MKFSNQLVKEYDNDADRRMSAICRIMTILMALVMLLNRLHVFKITNVIYPTVVVAIVILFIPTILYDVLHIRSKIARYAGISGSGFLLVL